MEVKVTDANFEQEVIKSDVPCLVDFNADWCGPCKMLEPVIKEIAEEYEGKIKVCSANVDDTPNFAGRFKVMGIPALFVFKNGEVVGQSVGASPKQAVEELIKPHI